MLRNKVIGLEGMLDLDATQWIFNNLDGNAFSSARVLAGFLTEDDFPEMEIPGTTSIDASEKVAGLESMLHAA